MGVLFAHDHRFQRDVAGTVYSTGKLPYTVWERYLAEFGTVTVAARMKEEVVSEASGSLTRASGPGVRFVAVPSLSSPVSQITRRARAMRLLEEALAPNDALIARLPSEIGALAIEVAARMGKPWCAEVVACPWDSFWNYGNWQARVYAPYVTLRTRNLVRRSPYAYYVTGEFLQRRYPTSGYAVGCSDVEIPAPDAEVLSCRLESIHTPKGTLRIGLIGSLFVNYKGIDTALQALARVKGQLPPFQFHILGDGDPERWRRLAARLGVAENTLFVGTLPSGGAVQEWLDRVDLYIQPSRQEGLSRALVEAMSRACPALASTAGGNGELVEARSLHAPGDYRALASLLVSAARDTGWQSAQAERNFAAASRYTRAELDPVRGAFWREFAQKAKGRAAGIAPDEHFEAGAGHAAGDAVS